MKDSLAKAGLGVNMGATDEQGLPLSTNSDVEPLWRDFRHRVDRFLSGVPEALAAVTEADPDFAVGRAAAALMSATDGLSGFDTGEEHRAALEGRANSNWERSYVQAVDDEIERGRWKALETWRAHHDSFPDDMLALHHLIPTLELSAEDGHGDETERRVRQTLHAVGEEATLLGQLGMGAIERLDLGEAERLGQRSLELEPHGLVGGHPIAHVRFESGEHAEGALWLQSWLPTTDSAALFHQHLAWHAGLHELAMGNREAVLARLEGFGSTEGPFARVTQGGPLLWRCQLHGLLPKGSDPIEPSISELATPLVDNPFAVAVGYHVAVALATVNDADGLRRLAENSRQSDGPGVAEIVPGIAGGFAAFVEGDHATASDLLLAAESHHGRLGGSLAQREVIEDTLIEALIRADRDELAIERLERRLGRRPSRFDEAALARAS